MQDVGESDDGSTPGDVAGPEDDVVAPTPDSEPHKVLANRSLAHLRVAQSHRRETPRNADNKYKPGWISDGRDGAPMRIRVEQVGRLQVNLNFLHSYS